MSTRGYVTIIDNQAKVTSAAYLRSDAYPSYYGLEVLDALRDDKLHDYIQNLQDQYPDDNEMVDGIQRDWYIKRKENADQFFVDYAYEYNPAKEHLTVYYFGQKALIIPKAEISLYHGIFRIHSALSIPLMYDPASCMLKKDRFKELHALVKAGVTLDELKATAETSILYMDKYRGRNRFMSESEFTKTVRDSKTGSHLKFYVAPTGRRFSLYVQTPFYFSEIICRPLASQSAAEKEIARLIRERPADIRGTMAVFQQIEQYKRAVSSIFQKDDIPCSEREKTARLLMDDMLSVLQEARKTCHLLGDRDDAFSRQIRGVFSSLAQNAYARESPPKPELDEMIASAETEAPNEKDPSTGRIMPKATPER